VNRLDSDKREKTFTLIFWGGVAQLKSDQVPAWADELRYMSGFASCGD
jgi:hypothetical protein